MIGFIVGTVCLVALIGLVNRRRYGYYAMAHGPWGHGFHHRHGCGDGFGYGGGEAFRSQRDCGARGYGRGRAALYMLLDRLDTTPGQDKAIRSALSDAFARLRDVREPLRELRTELAAAIQHDEFDRGQVDALFTRGEGRLRDARAAVIEAIERIHAALDSEQRKQLGKLLGDSGWSGFRNW